MEDFDGDEPDEPGALYYYLVSGANAGCGESGVGFDGDDVPRPNPAPCLIPPGE